MVFNNIHAFSAARQEEKLGGQAIIGNIAVKLHEKRIVIRILRQQQRAEMLCQAAAQSGLAATDGAFDNNITRIHSNSL